MLNSVPEVTWRNEPSPKEAIGIRADGWTLRGVFAARGAVGYGLCAGANAHTRLACPIGGVGMDQCCMRVFPHSASLAAPRGEASSLAPGLLPAGSSHTQHTTAGGSHHARCTAGWSVRNLVRGHAAEHCAKHLLRRTHAATGARHTLRRSAETH